MTEASKEIRYKVQRSKREGKLEKGSFKTLIDLLKYLDVPIDGAIVLSGSTPVPLDHSVEDLDRITIIEVSSGG